MTKLKDVAEEVRTHMEQNGQATGSVYALSSLEALHALGYRIMDKKPQCPARNENEDLYKP